MDISDFEINAKSDLEYLSQIGEFLKGTRLELDLTQNVVAERAGVDRTTLIKAERGDSINLLSLIQILRALGKLRVLENMKFTRQVSPIKMAELSMKKKRRASGNKPPEDKSQSDW
ncbi:helix-turn-helix transcriptional regulator [Pedobacter hiemivivus]|uniref:Helix-turn-helix transcriptional regulator n=1 Tax=Pedobacter hiemivivus TaxID=2530454 RepID=A0A4U1G6W0_9SPHI|nr:helix-turn-helix transcriptional regulator [Pedobacter hiemivivus]TKC59154.1 helix-turn-helix transcriptional regulator [Pedobacter hiemivivus]